MRTTARSAVDDPMPISIVGEHLSALCRYFGHLSVFPQIAGMRGVETPDMPWLPAQLDQIKPLAAAISTGQPLRIIPACDQLMDHLRVVVGKADQAETLRPLSDQAFRALMAAGAMRQMAEFWDEACA